jgi:hypothetical protein
VSSKLGRSTRGSRPTNRPPCFAQIWLDCSDLSIYLVFTEGQIYRYDPDSIDTGRALIEALNHGLTFNQVYRLFGVFGLTGAYERVSTIPGTAVMRYLNPPYPGSDPGPCVVNPFDNMVWIFTNNTPPPPTYVADPDPSGTQNFASVKFTGPPVAGGFYLHEDGSMTYTGGGGNFISTVAMKITAGSPGQQFVQTFLTQGGTTLDNQFEDTNGTYNFTTPFTLAPGVGVNQTILAAVEAESGLPLSAGVMLEVSMTLTPT